MKLLYVSKRDFTYNRDLILINGLKRIKGVHIELLTIEARNLSAMRIIRNKSRSFDFVVVPSFRHKDIAFIKLSSSVPVVFDPLISKYMTRVIDYGVRWKGPHKYLVDKLAFLWPDILIWDTLAHQEYLRNKYNLKQPMTAIYIGVDTSIFFPIKKNEDDSFIVGFYGSFNPLQGIDKIVKAAHLLKDQKSITFEIIGNGSTYREIRKLANELNVQNINFVDPVPYEDLNRQINRFDLCLGIFGDSLKSDVVIPNKVYHYTAARKAVITKDSPAIQELFKDSKNIALIKNTPQALAEKILFLKSNRALMQTMANNAYDMITTAFNQDQIALSFFTFLRVHLNSRSQ